MTVDEGHRRAVEVDGKTHSSDEEVAHDRRRDAHLKAQDLRVLRVTNDDVPTNLHGVCETIRAALENRDTL